MSYQLMVFESVLALLVAMAGFTLLAILNPSFVADAYQCWLQTETPANCFHVWIAELSLCTLFILLVAATIQFLIKELIPYWTTTTPTATATPQNSSRTRHLKSPIRLRNGKRIKASDA